MGEEMTVEEGLSLQLASERLELFRGLWSRAEVFSAALPPEARDIVSRKPSDVEAALEELVPVLGGLHPDVIAVVRQTLEGVDHVLDRVMHWYDASGYVPDNVEETLEDLNERVSAIETIMRGAGALMKTVGDGRTVVLMMMVLLGLQAAGVDLSPLPGPF